MSDSESQASILGLLTHDRNRRLFAEWLAPTYDVIVPDPNVDPDSELLASADLLVLDAGAHKRHAEAITKYRASDQPVFRPVLLLLETDPRNLPALLARVDDIVRIPVEKQVLAARIRGLLSRGALSRDLAASRTRFQTLFETSPEPTVVVEDSGTIVDGNAAFCDLFDVPNAELRGRALCGLDAFDQGTADTLIADTSGTDERSIVSYRTPAGETRYAECTSRILRPTDAGRHHETTQRIIALRDITERIRRERELERQIDRLDEFASVLAHEMRNPLTIAIGWLEQAETTGDAAAFDRVKAAHARINKMIGELLQLARQGRTIGDRAPISLAPLVLDAWEAVVTHDATLDLTPELTDYTVTGDRTRLQDVFINLFRNAVEHGGSTVSVSVGVHEDGAGIYVDDDGIGLRRIDQDRLFEPGYTTTNDGTGFGLAIVEQIIDAHGWTIQASDRSNGGARFEIRGITRITNPDSDK